MWLTLCHPTFCVLPPLLQVFLAAEIVVAVELSPEAAVLTAELSPEVVSVVDLGVSESEVAEPQVFALVFEAAELFPEVVVLAVGPEVVSVVDLGVSESEVVSVVVALLLMLLNLRPLLILLLPLLP